MSRCYICDYSPDVQSLFENSLSGDEYSQRRRSLLEIEPNKFICAVCEDGVDYEYDDEEESNEDIS